MIRLRPMTAGDLAIFKQWLSRPHVAKWYHDPADWIEEIEKQEDEFRWLHHFIVECDGRPIGFCQFYACENSEELWEGYTAMGGSYSIDYMIGEPDWLRKGIGRQIVYALIERITRHPDAQRIVVQPEEENKASCGLLLSCGFVFDTQTGIYVKAI